ncbi:hypothetical protein [Enterococcus sp. LJL51]|uniref:hypothetical protein n=1 Tax=Enterococcus sp. LJL51 TaxID=3416656 RepID=UPI003CF8EF7C
MKSSQKELASRGYLPEDSSIQKLSKEEAVNQLDAADPVKRSAAARLIGHSFILEAGAAKALLERLLIEKKLYSRMEICSALGKGNAQTVEQMIPYIGKLGKNQHQTIADAKSSKKKNYPLARDIIARTLANMGEFTVAVLFELLKEPEAIREGLDALGYQIFYSSRLQTLENFEKGKAYYERYSADLLLVWKFVTFCSAFPPAYTHDVLAEIEVSFSEKVIQEELVRTRKLSKIH